MFHVKEPGRYRAEEYDRERITHTLDSRHLVPTASLSPPSDLPLFRAFQAIGKNFNSDFNSSLRNSVVRISVTRVLLGVIG